MSQGEGDPSQNSLERSRKWIAVAIVVAILGYLAYSAWHGLSATAGAIAGFRWPLYAVVLLTTLVNYGLRYWKWSYLLGRVGVTIPHRTNAWVFLSGLAMVITPAKAGELVKPWLVRTVTGTPMARTVPVLVAERATDGIAVVALAAIGVSTYRAESVTTIAFTFAVIALALAVLAVEPLSLGLIRFFARLPVLGSLAERVEEAYRAMRSCLAPLPLTLTVLVSLVAWWAECLGTWLVFRGLAQPVTMDLATFLYASATVIGAPSPGGMGLADASLAEGARMLVPGITEGEAMAAALLVRIATLWFGVALGAFALLRVDGVIRRARSD
ncbi:MAG: flippase-like domain-containing protein [Deltaproteobacteria bacterium]|nr:flippase-like domain-containing protein [Deltaproteobacteria bacterium]